ncbi:MAG: hypothetical protein L3J24_08670 [Xanthomonadales bacterium]|nr:hypothetical protein [Xanthomonadales bacterium]
MDKQQLLGELAAKIQAGELTTAEVMQTIGLDSTSNTEEDETTSRLSTVLYFIGGGVVFLGMIFLIGQEWEAFSKPMKIFVTLGSGLAAFVVGVLLTNQQRLGAAGPAFFLISALLIPFGLLVAYDQFGIDVDAIIVIIQISGILFAAYLAAYLLMRENVLLTFALIFGSWLFMACMEYMVRGVATLDHWRFFSYTILLMGLAYMLMAYSFANTRRAVLSGWLYSFGVIGFLSAALVLGGWKPSQSIFWEAIYPGLVFAIIFLSTHLRSKSLLIFGSLALGVYLTKITAQYFSDSIGWASSLVLIGFMLMGVAYLAVRLNRRHVSQINQ